MKYYIYRNWVAEKKAVIHRADCGYCNDGKGCHFNPLGDRNGKWFGPFNKLIDAAREASKKYKTLTLKSKKCRCCK